MRIYFGEIYLEEEINIMKRNGFQNNGKKDIMINESKFYCDKIIISL